MKHALIVIAILAAGTAAAQQQPVEGRLPSEAACSAVRDRIQLALAQADRALQTEDNDEAERWSGIAANYATVHAAFCSPQLAE